MGWAGPVTHKQHRAYVAWQDEEWNQPNRSDFYTMALAAEVARTPAAVWGKNAKVKVGDMRLKFGQAKAAPALSVEEATRQARGRWRGMMGQPIKSTEAGEHG